MWHAYRGISVVACPLWHTHCSTFTEACPLWHTHCSVFAVARPLWQAHYGKYFVHDTVTEPFCEIGRTIVLWGAVNCTQVYHAGTCEIHDGTFIASFGRKDPYNSIQLFLERPAKNGFSLRLLQHIL